MTQETASERGAMQRTERATVKVETILGHEDPRIILNHWYGESTFRVRWITETFTRDDRYGETYEVTARGPRQTAKGCDHASNSGDCTWGDRRVKEPMPDEVAALCLGREGLAARLAAPLEAQS